MSDVFEIPVATDIPDPVLPLPDDTSSPDSFVPEGDTFTGSGNDISFPIDTPPVEQVINYTIEQNLDFDYETLVEQLERTALYTIYPNAQAVAVYRDVLNSYDGDFGYVLTSGTSSSDVYLYVSRDYTVSGSQIVLQYPVTVHRYYTYRPSSSSSTQYRYQVSQNAGQQSFNLGTALVYTNLKDGYPDIMPYKRNFSYFSVYFIMFILFLLFGLFLVKNRRD